jgi:hypothetical protein
MGIESIGRGREAICVVRGMGGSEACLLLRADLVRACSAWREETVVRGGESGRRTGGRFFLAHVTSAWLEKSKPREGKADWKPAVS